jgi:hypothetical protein
MPRHALHECITFGLRSRLHLGGGHVLLDQFLVTTPSREQRLDDDIRSRCTQSSAPSSSVTAIKLLIAGVIEKGRFRAGWGAFRFRCSWCA